MLTDLGGGQAATAIVKSRQLGVGLAIVAVILGESMVAAVVAEADTGHHEAALVDVEDKVSGGVASRETRLVDAEDLAPSTTLKVVVDGQGVGIEAVNTGVAGKDGVGDRDLEALGQGAIETVDETFAVETPAGRGGDGENLHLVDGPAVAVPVTAAGIQTEANLEGVLSHDSSGQGGDHGGRGSTTHADVDTGDVHLEGEPVAIQHIVEVALIVVFTIVLTPGHVDKDNRRIQVRSGQCEIGVDGVVAGSIVLTEAEQHEAVVVLNAVTDTHVGIQSCQRHVLQEARESGDESSGVVGRGAVGDTLPFEVPVLAVVGGGGGDGLTVDDVASSHGTDGNGLSGSELIVTQRGHIILGEDGSLVVHGIVRNYNLFLDGAVGVTQLVSHLVGLSHGEGAAHSQTQNE